MKKSYLMLAKIETQLGGLHWVLTFLLRLAVGMVFIRSGLGKIQNIHGVSEFFHSLGIPYSIFLAPIVAIVETVCGAALVAGFYSRLLSLPLIAVMTVAILTAKKTETANLINLFGLEEFLLALILFAIAVIGSGPLSLDRLIRKVK